MHHHSLDTYELCLQLLELSIEVNLTSKARIRIDKPLWKISLKATLQALVIHSNCGLPEMYQVLSKAEM